MRYVFDSSAVFKAIKENSVEVLDGNCTIELARYELCNILWKDYVLKAKITETEFQSLIGLVKQTLSIMKVLQIHGSEEMILDVAVQIRVPFYDASFAYYAKLQDLILVTEDTELLKKAAPYTKVSNLNSGIVSET